MSKAPTLCLKCKTCCKTHLPPSIIVLLLHVIGSAAWHRNKSVNDERKIGVCRHYKYNQYKAIGFAKYSEEAAIS